jgi:hypothetical protein
MEYWYLRLLNNWWIAPLLRTHNSIIPLFQYSDPVKWVGATLACLREAASAKAGRPKGRLKPPLPNVFSMTLFFA